MRNLCHIINTCPMSKFKFSLYDKINEIILYDFHNYIDTFSDILDENGETIELIHYWIGILKPYIATLNEY